jgi:DNA polymerase-3 subunit beta
MKLQVTQENLNRALNSVARVADTRGTLPILANVLIKAQNNRLSISATNLDIAITHFIGAKIEKGGEITVPASLLANFVASLPDGVIKLELEENKLKVTTDQYQSSINGIVAEDFPVMPAIEKEDAIKVNSKNVKKAFQQVVFAASTADSRPVLCGVYIFSRKNKLYVVATDSSRLAEKEVGTIKTAKEISILVPASAINDLVRVLDDNNEEIRIVHDKQQVLFSFDDIELVARLIDSPYPNYSALIPDTFTIKANLKRQDLFNIVKVSSLFARETAGSLTLELSEKNQTIGINALASQLGENKAVAPAKVKGEGSVTLNSKFLTDAINAFSGENINFSFSDKLKPVLLTDPAASDYRHIIMPIKA